jgi:spore germination protein YaaH
LKKVNADKLVVAIGNYGYDWNTTKKSSPTTSLSFGEALTIARESE